LDPEVPANKALLLMVNSQEARPPGRPRRTWLNLVQEDANAIPLSSLWRTEISRDHGAAQDYAKMMMMMIVMGMLHYQYSFMVGWSLVMWTAGQIDMQLSVEVGHWPGQSNIMLDGARVPQNCAAFLFFCSHGQKKLLHKILNKSLRYWCLFAGFINLCWNVVAIKRP